MQARGHFVTTQDSDDGRTRSGIPDQVRLLRDNPFAPAGSESQRRDPGAGRSHRLLARASVPPAQCLPPSWSSCSTIETVGVFYTVRKGADSRSRARRAPARAHARHLDAAGDHAAARRVVVPQRFPYAVDDA